MISRSSLPIKTWANTLLRTNILKIGGREEGETHKGFFFFCPAFPRLSLFLLCYLLIQYLAALVNSSRWTLLGSWWKGVKLRWPLHRAVEFFISAQLGHKWLQSRLNIVQAHRLGAEKRSQSVMLSTRPCLCIFADLCFRTPHITVCFISQTQNLWVNSNYKALQSKCCFLTIPALNL